MRGAVQFALAMTMLLLATGSAAGAEYEWSLEDLDRHLVLDWDAPAECPSERAVRERIRTLLKAKSETDHRVHATAKVTRTPAGYALDLAVADGPARAIASEQCVGLVEATAIIIALDIETHAKPTPSTPSMPEATPPSPLAPRAPRARAVAPRPAARVPSAPAHPLRLAVGALTVGDVGSLPEPTAGYRATFALGYRAFRAEASATVFASRNADGLREGTGVRVGLETGALNLCRSWELSRSAVLDTCLGGELGSSTATGYGITRRARSTGPWTSVLASSQLRVRWAHPLVLGVEAGVTPSRATAFIHGQGTVFDPAPWLARVTIGVEFEFLPGARMK